MRIFLPIVAILVLGSAALAAPFDDGDMKARAPFLVMRFAPPPVAVRARCG